MTAMRLAVSALALGAFLAPALGHEVLIKNNAPVSVVHASARPGKLEGFKRISAGSYKTFNVSTPEGVCDVKLHLEFDDGGSIDADVEICGGLQFTVTNGKY